MNIKEAYSIASNNIKGRKKIGGLISVIFFIALFISFLINSLANSIDELVNSMSEMPMARTLTFEIRDEVPKDFREVCENIDYVTEVVPYVFQIAGEIEGLTENVKKEMDVKAYSKAYADYLVEGEAPEKGEILIPHYLNMATGGRYRDGSKYIGQNITVYVDNYNDETKAFTYKVSGTYDNIYAMLGMEAALLQSDDAVEMKEYTYGGVEDELERDKAENGYDDSIVYLGYEMVYEYAIVVDSYKNVEKVNGELYEKGIYASVEVDVSENELQKVFDIIQLIGAALTAILVIAVIIMMVIMIGNDIRGRKKEMAMYLIQGYTKKDLQQILSMEYARRLTPVLITVAVVTKLILMLGNLGIKKLFTAEFQILHLEMGLVTLIIGIVILLIVLAAAVRYISENLKKIDLLKEIKSEG